MTPLLLGCLIKFGVFCFLCTLAVSACLPFAKELPNMRPLEIYGGPFDGKCWLLDGVPYLGAECKFMDQQTGDVYLYEAALGDDGRMIWRYVKQLTCKKLTAFSCEMAVSE